MITTIKKVLRSVQRKFNFINDNQGPVFNKPGHVQTKNDVEDVKNKCKRYRNTLFMRNKIQIWLMLKKKDRK